MPPPVFRFAPSPNGFLHLGHAYSALLNFDLARENGGRMLLRIEDIDPTRCRPEYENAIFEDLAWLGIAWEQPVRRQSEHLDVYREAVERLEREGLVYPAFESRSQIVKLVIAKDKEGAWPRDPDNAPLYPGHAKDMSARDRATQIASGARYVLRLDMAKAAARSDDLSWNEEGSGPAGETGRVAARPEQWGDVIIARKETPTSYHLAVTVDDHLQGVTLVSRGEDLLPATHVHGLLQALLDYHTPRYAHHRLLTDAQGRRFAKRDQALTLRALREAGVAAADVRKRAGFD